MKQTKGLGRSIFIAREFYILANVILIFNTYYTVFAVVATVL